MINLNRIDLIGNLTKDPELRFTPTNQAIASFSVATNRSYKDPQGNWIDSPPEYHDVAVWGQLAERVNQTLHRGDRVYLSGRTQTRSWEAQDGTKKYRTEVVADTLIGPDSINKSERPGVQGAPRSTEESQSTPKQQASVQPAPTASDEINIDDIPF